jgi:cellulose synthase/poly-beta-1,6-N-acetylglucosamine synthase-like glycosyltransferase
MQLAEIAFVALILYTVPFVFYQVVTFERSFKITYSVKEVAAVKAPDPKVSIIVPTKGEDISTIVELVKLLSSSRYFDSFEIIIVSDDDEGYVEELRGRLSEFDNVRVFRREVKRGYKACALQYGLERATGEYIATLDVDSRLDPDDIVRAIELMEREGCDAVTLRWKGYYKRWSLTALGVLVTTALVSRSLFLGRKGKNFAQFPVGSGTIFRATSLRKVGGWDCDVIQDDLDIGSRLMSSGMSVCPTPFEIRVEVPSTLKAFVIQQSRWSYGTAETLRKNALKIVTSRQMTFLKKLDAIWYLLQYTPISAVFTAMTLLAVLTFTPYGFDAPLWLMLAWALSLTVYAYAFMKETEEVEGVRGLFKLRSLGRISSLSAGISPYILYGFVRGLTGGMTYRVTPKGGKSADKYVPKWTAILGAVYMASSVKYLLNNDFISALWLFYYGLAYVYTVYVGLKEG